MLLAAMKTPFKLSLQPSLILLSFGLTLCVVPAGFVARAGELPTPTVQQNPPEQPMNPLEKSPPQTESKKPELTPSQRRNDRVYIKDVFPEYCRMYFHRRDWVSLFEYQRGMQRCFYGNDRWF